MSFLMFCIMAIFIPVAKYNVNTYGFGDGIYMGEFFSFVLAFYSVVSAIIFELKPQISSLYVSIFDVLTYVFAFLSVIFIIIDRRSTQYTIIYFLLILWLIIAFIVMIRQVLNYKKMYLDV